ncbi:OB-fold-containig protein [Halovulum sp. GXIMD14794]
MIEILSQDGLRPFLVSAVLVFAFLGLEILLLAVGLSGSVKADAPELNAPDTGDFIGMGAADIATEMDIDPGIAASIEAEIAAQVGAIDVGTPAASGAEATSTLGTALDLLGLRALPLSASLALFAACFASLGLSPQILLYGAFGIMLPVWIMAPVAFIGAAALTRRLSGFVARLIPRDETAAVSERSLGRRKGIVTVGTARKGHPAQVRVSDRYGNTHYIMVEPLADADVIAEGSEVLVLCLPRRGLRLVEIG